MKVEIRVKKVPVACVLVAWVFEAVSCGLGASCLGF